MIFIKTAIDVVLKTSLEVYFEGNKISLFTMWKTQLVQYPLYANSIKLCKMSNAFLLKISTSLLTTFKKLNYYAYLPLLAIISSIPKTYLKRKKGKVQVNNIIFLEYKKINE